MSRPAGSGAASPAGSAVGTTEGSPEDTMEGTADLAERIAGTVEGCPGVAGLSAGAWGRTTTYRPGLPLLGVVVRDTEIEVGVVIRPGRPVTEIAEEVRVAVAPLADGRPVNVMIEDIDDGPAE